MLSKHSKLYVGLQIKTRHFLWNRYLVERALNPKHQLSVLEDDDWPISQGSYSPHYEVATESVLWLWKTKRCWISGGKVSQVSVNKWWCYRSLIHWLYSGNWSVCLRASHISRIDRNSHTRIYLKIFRTQELKERLVSCVSGNIVVTQCSSEEKIRNSKKAHTMDRL